ncbi:hypothetical protein M8J76_004471 [Diaphorina citri]|nr:hypothetical protein M8J76_004471 [Diaphorina citri]
MEIQEMQSMDWLFKKERIYLLAQFWQQYFAGFPVNVLLNQKYYRIDHVYLSIVLELFLQRSTTEESEDAA